MSPLRIGVDTGGTFTDFVYRADGETHVHKEPSTPDNPADAIVRGVQHLLGDRQRDIVHGSTVATNALLERRGARTMLITTSGFEDLLDIGRQTRREIYAIDVTKPPPLVGPNSCLGVHERVGADGEVVTPLEPDETERLCAAVKRAAPDAVAICLLHSYANPAHEAAIAAALRESFQGFVCASHAVLPEFREYERCSTTVINAYVGPVMSRYLDDLERRVGARRLHVLQSNGGALALETARRHAVHTILSGPAGGVVGAFGAALEAGYDQVITFDMGGTSTDVSLCPGQPARTSESELDGLPVRVPVLDIHTVGAGGGSVAWADPGGSLRVGPRSAGARPGPICYGQGGTEVTVTDANLVLGRLSSEHFLGGKQHLDNAAAIKATEHLSHGFGSEGAELAEGILQVANATMESAIRVISFERGHDPRDFTMVCFGGAGGMHAATIAESLAIARVLVPPSPGTLSAQGMLQADAMRDFSRTLLVATEAADLGSLEREWEALEAKARGDELLAAGADRLVLARSLDMRYRGQGFEIRVPWGAEPAEEFHRLHARRYGYADPTRATEIVTLRLEARLPVQRPARAPSPLADAAADGARIAEQQMRFDGSRHRTPLFDRDRLASGARLHGPALLVEYSSTTVVPPGWECRVDGYANLVLEPIP